MGYPHYSGDCAEFHALVRDFGGARPRIVCLCGSSRFYEAFQQANYDETMAGRIVLSIGFYPHSKAEHGHGEGVGHDSAEKVALDELHKRKIDLADEVLVLNVGGYAGESTRSEVEYARQAGKPIRWLETGAPCEDDWARMSGYPIRQRSARGLPLPFSDITRRCTSCGACFIGLAAGKTGERGIWREWRWYCSRECDRAASERERGTA